MFPVITSHVHTVLVGLDLDQVLFYGLLLAAALLFIAPFVFKYYVLHRSRQYILSLTRPDLRYNKLTAEKPICPYMGSVLSSKGLRVRYVWPHEWSNLEEICRQQLEEQEHNHVRSAGFVIVPFLSYDRLIAVWKKLRLEAIPVGKMFGEFHPDRCQTGLHSDSVFPLQTPFPSFGIRSMVPQDAAFFEKFEEDDSVKAVFDKYFTARWPANH